MGFWGVLSTGLLVETVWTFDFACVVAAIFLLCRCDVPVPVADLPVAGVVGGVAVPAVAGGAGVTVLPVAGAAGCGEGAVCASTGSAANASAPARSRPRVVVTIVLVMVLGIPVALSVSRARQTPGERGRFCRPSKANP